MIIRSCPHSIRILRGFAIFLAAWICAPAFVLASPIEIGLDQEISGEILPGEELVYELQSLQPGQRVYVQQIATSNFNGLNWLLEDEFGRVVREDPGRLEDLGPVSLMGGLYRLTVRGETPTAAGTFSFIVHGVEDTSSALAMDVADTQAISGIGATHVFDLSVNEPGPVRLFFSGANPGQLSYRLVDSLGNLRQDWTTSGPAVSDPFNLPGGVHRIEVRGRNDYFGDLTLQVRPVEDPVPVALPLDGSAGYDSADLTETTEFQFTLADTTAVFVTFDFAHGSAAGQWRLDRADGPEISGWTNNMNPPGDPWQLVAGDYRLSVRSRSTTSIEGTATLHEVADSLSLLAPDTPATAEILVPGQEHRFDLSALPAGTYLLDQLDSDATNALNWWIENALGETLLARTSNVSDVEGLVLKGGDYRLVVSGESAATGFVDFSLTTMTVVETPTSLGSVINDAIVQPGEIRRYTFNSPTNRKLSIDRQSSSNAGALAYVLIDAVGRELVSRGTFLPSLTELRLVGGDYVLEVLAEGGATGDYVLALDDDGPAVFPPSGTPLALGDLAEDTIESGSPQRWLISLVDTRRVYFELVTGATNLAWTLFDASGQPLFDSVRARFPGTDDRGPFMLAAGDYTIEFELVSGEPADYAFRAIDSAATETSINLDEIIDSPPTVRGFRDDYLFTVPAQDSYYFELLQGDNQLRWRLESIDGEPVFGTSLARFPADSLGAFDLAAGDYRLRFEATGNAAPGYQFRIQTVTDLTDSLTLGAAPLPVSTAMAMPGQTHDYDLTIEPGRDRLYVQVESGDTALRYSLLDAAGRALIDSKRLAFPLTDDAGPLPIEPGQYRLVVEMLDPTTSAYSLTLHAQAASPAQNIALDETVSWTPPGAGAEQRFLFDSARTPPRAFFDALTDGSGVFATLRHVPSGWALFSNVNLNFAQNADRGPWNLPPGQFELILQALPNAGEPSWQVRSVVDESAGPIEIDRVIEAEFASPGGTLSFTFEPEEAGQSLIFDLMFSADSNQWELIDPVGTSVFGRVNAANPGSHDRGPFSLADGVYTLVFSNTRNLVPEWLFQVATAETNLTVPEGCAACSALDVVFTFDTSPSMDPVNQTMCDITTELVQVLADDGIPINSRFWGISALGAAECLTSDVATELGTIIPGTPPSFMTTLDQCNDGFAGDIENWGPAVALVANDLAWDPDAVRLVIPVADEGSYCGSPVNDLDIESVYYARQIAAQNDVVVSPLVPSIAPDEVRAMAGLITVGTGGISTIADFDLEDILPVARSIAIAACGTAQTVAAPEFTDLSPRPGTLLPSGVPLVLSGRVLPVNELRPVLEVEVNGQPSSVLDGSGSFFATIELQPGPNLVTISAVEACGPTVLEIELMGAGDETDPWAGFAEVSDLLEGEFSRATFDQPNQRLLVDVAVRNPGAALRGPILMAVGMDLDPGVSLLNADGQTPNGEPFVVLVPEGEILPADSVSAVRELAFSNPGLDPIDFEPRWILPANQAPHFTTVPATRATVGRAWSYAAEAEDGDGDSVTYSLLVAPPGMTLSAGTLSWTPASAGSFDVVLRARDGRGGVGRQSFSVNVVEAGFNAPPIFTSSPVIQAPIGANYSYQAAVIDPDGDNVNFALLSAPAGLEVDPVSGLVSWTNAQPGQHSVILEADDGQGGQSSQSYTLFIGEPATTPAGPSFVSTPVAFAGVSTQYRYRYRLGPPQDPPPTVVLAQGPDDMVLDPIERTLVWVPAAGDLGPHVIELIATDSSGQQANQRFVLTVLENLPNQAPYITTTPPLFAVVGQPWSYPSDAVDPEFAELTYSVDEAPDDLTIDPVSGQLDWTPAPGTPASVPVTLVVSDPDGLSAEQAFEVVVRPSNAAPSLDSTPPAAVLIGQTYNHLFIANDADGDSLTFSLLSGPTGMALDAEAGWLSWPTAGVVPGLYEYEIEVADDWGGRVSSAFSVNVVEDSEAPSVAIVIARQPACATEPVAVCLQAGDNVGIASRELQIDGEPQTLTAGCVDWTPPLPGNVPAFGTASDITGLTSETSVSLQVSDCNDEQKPVVTLFSPTVDSLLLEPTPLIVSIDDDTPEALTWTVSIRAGLDGEPEVLSEGIGAVDQAEVAVIDTTLLAEGEYWISILGSDGIQTGGIEYRVNVGAGYKPGRLRIANADVNLPLAGVPLTIGRSYDSLDAGRHGKSPGDLGPGWRLALSGSVTDSAREPTDPDNPLAALLAEPFSQQTRVSVIKPDGERVGFTFAPKQKSFPSLFQFDVEFEADPGVEDTLRAVDGPQIVWALGAGFADYIIPYNPSIYELETPERVVYVFSEEEGLIEIRDALGGILTISDDGIQSSRGPAIDYVRDEMGRVTEILLPPAEPGAERGKVVYGFDALGNLSTMTDLGGGVTRFEYDNTDYPHHLSAVIDPRGVAMTRQIYDADGRLIAQCPADGDSATLEGCTTYNFDIAGSVETIFDTRGFQSDLVYDENGQVVSRRDWTSPTEWIEQVWVYDDHGRVIEHVDGEGGSTLYEYDEVGNELSRTLPGGQTYRWTYGDCRSEWLTATDPMGNVWQQTFDDDCHLRFATDPLGGVTEYQYDAQGLRTAIIDPVGQAWTFTFTASGLVETVTDPRGRVRSHEYDGLGQETRVIQRNGQQIDYVYDEAGRLQSETWVGTGHVRNWDYNEVGLIIRESSPDSTVEVEYWPIGRIKRLDHSAPGAPSWWVAYEYDGNGNVLEVSDSAGGLTSYEYDPLDRMTSVEQSGTGVLPKRVEVEYNRASLVRTIRRFGDLDGNVLGPYSVIDYACESCLTELNRIDHRRPDDSSVHELLFTRNANAQNTQIIDAEGTHTFVYDGRGWLIEFSHPPVPGLDGGSIAYDAMGNWLNLPGQPGTATLSYGVGDGGHELINDGVNEYDYDERGALVVREDSTSGQTLELDRDPASRLISAILRDDQGAVLSEGNYRYTPAGMRVFAEVEGQRRHFIRDGENVIAALDDAGEVVWRRLHPRSVDRPLAVDDGTTIQWLLSDHNGSIRDVVDTSGQALAHFAYTPFGKQVLGPPPSLDDPIRFTGREFDLPGGLGYFRARNYDPSIARFLSQDPLEPWHYRYAENNPLRFNDPSGEVAAIEYLLMVCDALSAISFGQASGAVFEEAINQVVAGFSGTPGNPEKVLEKLKDWAVGQFMFCGLPSPL